MGSVVHDTTPYVAEYGSNAPADGRPAQPGPADRQTIDPSIDARRWPIRAAVSQSGGLTPGGRRVGVVLVHGGVHSAACWAAVQLHLNAESVAVDLPGRGGCPGDITTVQLTDCVRAVMDSANKAGFDRFVLVGHSLGGVTITETAWWYPQRVAHLVYVGALVPAPGLSASIVMTGSDLPAGLPVIIDEAVAKALFGNDLTEGQWTEYWRGSVPESPSLMNARISGYPQGIPITYISMSDDLAVPLATVEQMIANLPRPVRRRALCGGHIAMVSRPRELAAMIDNAMCELDATPQLP